MLDVLETEEIADEFAFQQTDQAETEETSDKPVIQTALLKSTALEALDAPADDTPVSDEAQTDAAPNLDIHVEDHTAETVEAPAPITTADEDTTPDVSTDEDAFAYEQDIVLDTSIDELSAYDAACYALFAEKFPGGFDELFADGISGQVLYDIAWGLGPISGSLEWTETDNMFFNGVLITIGSNGYDPYQIWDDFQSSLGNQLIEAGFNLDQIDTIYEGIGPISGETEWTALDYMAVDDAMVKLATYDFEQYQGDDETVIIDYANPYDEYWTTLPFEDDPQPATCDLMPPPEMVICDFPPDTLIEI